MRLIFLLAAFISFSLQAVAKPPKSTEDGPYHKLIQLYSECMQLEDALFSRLSFELSSEQLIKTGSHLKLTLLDNFGKPWIFKPAYSGSFNESRETAGYRIYKLFGLDSPETHVITLTLNGKIEKGTIQRYVEHQPGLSGFMEYGIDGLQPENEITNHKLKLAPEAISYLLKAQTLDWLLKSYDARFDNFIILSREDGIVNSLCRIDLEALLDGGDGDYNYDYMIYESRKPWFKKEKISYFWISQEYKSGNIDIDWKANLPFVEFVADMPDDFLKLQALPVIQIKKNLVSDFGKFYQSLTGEPGSGGWYFSGGRDAEISKVCDILSRRLEELKAEKNKSKDLIVQPTKIEARVCVEGYRIINQFLLYREYSSKSNRWKAEFDRTWRSLSKLEEESSSQREKEALRYYKQQMRIMRIVGFPGIVPTEIDLSLIKN
jgi:hypothetical protein